MVCIQDCTEEAMERTKEKILVKQEEKSGESKEA
jgi:hypothetical protein